ncbi:hypothetical protein I4U23_021912 [Adineta vaga]|nr:hypothetical protein I4U23_021912 [Adineta vaga]
MPQTESAKTDMLTESRAQYHGQAVQLDIIQEFENDYSKNLSNNTIWWWYTRECFLYRLLNKALRTENIDIIFKYRFFIKDLHEKLCELHANASSDIFVVYRGQAMSIAEINVLSTNIDGLISFNTFVSTSENKNGAILFAKEAVDKRSNVEPVLFEITLLQSMSSVVTSQPYANIKEWSLFKEEEEVLLSLGTICRVASVEEPSAKTSFVCHVKLNMKDKDDEQLKMLKQYIGLETKEQPTIADFGILFLKLGDLVRAERYFSMMIEKVATYDAKHIIDRCELYNNMGVVYAQKAAMDEWLRVRHVTTWYCVQTSVTSPME